MTRRTRFLSSLIAVLVLGLASPAFAASWHASDARGDAEGFSSREDDDPCAEPVPVPATGVPNLDVTHLGVRHTRSTVEIAVRIHELRGGELSLSLPLLVPGRDFTVDVDLGGGFRFVGLTRDEQKTLEQAQAAHPDACSFSYVTSPRGCRGLTARRDLARHQVRVSLPRRCVGDPRWIKVGAQTSAFTTTDEGFDHFHDEWTPSPASPSRLRPYYSPRVLHPAGP